MFSGLSDNRAYQFIPDEPPVSLEALRDRYVFLSEGGNSDGTEIWLNWVIRQAVDQKAVGYTQATLTAEEAIVAYHIFPAYWRQGIAAEAMKLTLKTIFHNPDIKIARAFVDTRNHASIGLLHKLGLKQVRTIHDADFFKGANSHEYEFEITQTEWLKTPILSQT
ncbi:acetyltransferase [Gluconobacter japonicus]|nr:acetyltransferase [Gluconobacter japonicus]